MNLYKTRPFSRLAGKTEITDDMLKATVAEMQKGIVHANLGGNVYKQRVAVKGRGKRGGSRVIVAANLQDRWIFVHCYLKNDKENITSDEEHAFKELARVYLSFSGEALQTAVERGVLEVIL
jgi:hypothetical protein